jgi:hypothetical protein
MPLPRNSLVAVLVLAAGCSPGGSNNTVGEDGFGPVRFGTQINEAAQLLGVELKQDDYTDDDSCRYYAPAKGLAGLTFMTSNGIVVRVDVHDTVEIETDRGAKIGDSEAYVLKLYEGRTKVEPRFYGGLPDHYIKVLDENGVARLIFETRNGKIDSYRAGRMPEVEYVEGCL